MDSPIYVLIFECHAFAYHVSYSPVLCMLVRYVCFVLHDCILSFLSFVIQFCCARMDLHVPGQKCFLRKPFHSLIEHYFALLYVSPFTCGKINEVVLRAHDQIVKFEFLSIYSTHFFFEKVVWRPLRYWHWSQTIIIGF